MDKTEIKTNGFMLVKLGIDAQNVFSAEFIDVIDECLAHLYAADYASYLQSNGNKAGNVTEKAGEKLIEIIAPALALNIQIRSDRMLTEDSEKLKARVEEILGRKIQ